MEINKFIPKSDSPSKHEYQTDSNNQAEISNDEDTFPYPMPLDLVIFFAEPNEFVHVSTSEIDSDYN